MKRMKPADRERRCGCKFPHASGTAFGNKLKSSSPFVTKGMDRSISSGSTSRVTLSNAAGLVRSAR